ncbi:hypothetical protein Sjap_002653 [Stephania japonica]|uniref:Uncharacterized protein n=1 Tax=Stephania japonica TaxID=461633 RepID=A0AAP0KMB1_9MAGN
MRYRRREDIGRLPETLPCLSWSLPAPEASLVAVAIPQSIRPAKMFWHIAGLSSASPVDTILDKDNFTLEDLLDEDEIIQECKALNGRLINFLRERVQVEQLLRFIVEEAPEDSEKKRTFKFPFIACEIFTCEVDVILKTLVEDEELMNLLFSFLEPSHSHSTLLAGYFSKDCPEAHANAAETLCAIARYAPSSLAGKIYSPSFVGRLFRHALEESRPKSVLVHSLSVCISLLDPKRLTSGDLLKLLDISTSENVLATTYGSLQPPLGKHRLKIIEFISTLQSIGSEAAEKELIRLGAIQRVLDLFFEYPFNNFLHHHVENIVVSCLESNKDMFTEYLLQGCDLIKKMLEAEKHSTLESDLKRPTVPNEGKPPPRIGNIGHITRIANKLINLGNNNNKIQAYLQENTEWLDWHANILAKRNTVENVYQWACGRPTALHDRTRDSDDDDYRDRDYDVAALANNLSQAFRYGVYGNDDSDEDVYFDDESAEVVISSLRLGDEPDSASLFTNSNWFAFEDDQMANERSSGSPASPSPNTEAGIASSSSDDEVVVGEDDELVDTATSSQEPGTSTNSDDTETAKIENGVDIDLKEDTTSPSSDDNKPAEWVQWRETSDSTEPDVEETPTSSNCRLEDAKEQNDVAINTIPSEPSSVNPETSRIHEGLQGSSSENPGSNPSKTSEQDSNIKDLDGAAVEGMELGSADVAVEGMEVASTEGTNETAKTEDEVAVEAEA